MTAAEVERLAREAGAVWPEAAELTREKLARFAALVQASELMKSADEIDAAVAAERERNSHVIRQLELMIARLEGAAVRAG